jgi:hypothetical protein
MFENKSFETKLKNFKSFVGNSTFKYFPNPEKKTWLILKFMINQTLRAFKCNFQAPLIQLWKRFTPFRSFEEIAKFVNCAM